MTKVVPGGVEVGIGVGVVGWWWRQVEGEGGRQLNLIIMSVLSYSIMLVHRAAT